MNPIFPTQTGLSIAILADRFPLSSTDVLAWKLEKFALRLAARGHQITVLTAGKTSGYRPDGILEIKPIPSCGANPNQDLNAAPSGMESLVSRTFRNLCRFSEGVRTSGSAKSIAKKGTFDIVHAWNSVKSRSFAKKLAQEGDLPLVVSLEAADVAAGTSSPLSDKVIANTLRWLESSDVAVTSNAWVRRLIEEISGQRIEQIGLDASFESQDVPSAGSVPRILFCDTIDEGSGIAYLVRALPYVLREMDAKLVLMGTGTLVPHVKQLIQLLNLGHAIEWIEEPTRQEFQWLYQQCHVYVNSRVAWANETGVGMPPGVLEAFAAGKPAIGTRFTTYGDIIQHGRSGWLVESADEYSLAKGILSVLVHRQRGIRFGEAGQARLRREYDWKLGLSRLEKLYVQAMTRKMKATSLLTGS